VFMHSRLAIVWHSPKQLSVKRMCEIMTACVIIHNIIVEEERDDSICDQGWEFQGELVAPNPGLASFQEFLHAHREIRDRTTHKALH
jgi:hypothetical protein